MYDVQFNYYHINIFHFMISKMKLFILTVNTEMFNLFTLFLSFKIVFSHASLDHCH